MKHSEFAYFNSNWGLIEKYIDKSIPFAVLLLLIIIIVELFFKDLASANHTLFNILDKIVIGIFIIDLSYKYMHLRNFKNFVKIYWLDILVVFPFFLFFRFFESLIILLRIPEIFDYGQSIIHTGFEIQKEVSILIADAEKIGTKFRIYYSTISRIFPRLIRLLKIISYEKRHDIKIFK